MGFFENIGRKIKSDVAYSTGNEVSSSILNAGRKLFKKGKGKKVNKCPKCGAPITPGLKFCPKCGAKLVVTCPKCHVDYPIGTKFCPKCGMKLK